MAKISTVVNARPFVTFNISTSELDNYKFISNGIIPVTKASNEEFVFISSHHFVTPIVVILI